MNYEFSAIEAKWHKYWEENDTFHTDVWDFSKPKYYVLDMFPYPSGVGLHAGHPEGYTATDIMSRMKRMQGYNVLHPMGYDSFGLPAEQYAVSTGNHPNGFTQKNIETFSNQLKELGFDYDWSKVIATSDPDFYKWTQWIFKKLWEKGYAKRIEMPVNWCEALGTVLANDEVIDGKSERGGYPVVKKNMMQWVIDQPAFAEKLLDVVLHRGNRHIQLFADFCIGLAGYHLPQHLQLPFCQSSTGGIPQRHRRRLLRERGVSFQDTGQFLRGGLQIPETICPGFTGGGQIIGIRRCGEQDDPRPGELRNPLHL